jgi:hypothetical protein
MNFWNTRQCCYIITFSTVFTHFTLIKNPKSEKENAWDYNTRYTSHSKEKVPLHAHVA